MPGVPGTPPMWHIGPMGPNATTDAADRVFDVLVAVMETKEAPVSA